MDELFAGSRVESFSWKISALLLALVVPAPAVGCVGAGQSYGLGPLGFRSQGPGQALRLTPLPRAPAVLAAGEQEFRAMAAVSSVYARDRGYTLDMHLADSRIAIATGLGDCWELEVAVDERAMVNAYLDDLTLGFHRLFGFDDSGHDQADRNTTDVRFPGYGVALDEADRGAFSRSVEMTATRLLVPQAPDSPSVAMMMMARQETLEGGHDADLGLGLSVGQVLGRNRLYLDLTHIWFGTNNYLGIPLDMEQFAGMAAYEWRRSERFSWLAQYLYTDGVIKGLGALDEPAHEVQLGAKWRAGGVIAELALIENIITYNNSPDFGFAFGLKIPF